MLSLLMMAMRNYNRSGCRKVLLNEKEKLVCTAGCTNEDWELFLNKDQ